MTKEEFTRLEAIVRPEITNEELAKTEMKTTVDQVLEALVDDYESFELGQTLTFEEFWAQEKKYVLQYGTTAFNAGHAGLTKSNPLKTQ